LGEAPAISDFQVNLALMRAARPKFALPAGACDCHAHIFGPFDRFPLPADCDSKWAFAPALRYFELLRRLGVERSVLVQPSAYRTDCSALLDALGVAPDAARGVAVKDRTVSDDELQRLGGAGVRGLRFNELVGGSSAIGLSELVVLAPRLRELSWHAQIYAACDALAAMLPSLERLRVPCVFDHLARIGPPARPLDDPAFKRILDALREGAIWVKLTAYRNSQLPPSFADVRPFHDALVAANEDQVIWGSDWPFLSAREKPPVFGDMLDRLGDWTTDAKLREKILSLNPARLYGFHAK
jgi:2-pyrone-4,6-dicarboxylate lactonase